MMAKIPTTGKIREGSQIARIVWIIVLVLLMVLCLFPFLYMILMSLIDAKMLRVNISTLMESKYSFDNYLTLFKENN